MKNIETILLFTFLQKSSKSNAFKD